MCVRVIRLMVLISSAELKRHKEHGRHRDEKGLEFNDTLRITRIPKENDGIFVWRVKMTYE